MFGRLRSREKKRRAATSGHDNAARCDFTRRLFFEALEERRLLSTVIPPGWQTFTAELPAGVGDSSYDVDWAVNGSYAGQPTESENHLQIVVYCKNGYTSASATVTWNDPTYDVLWCWYYTRDEDTYCEDGPEYVDWSYWREGEEYTPNDDYGPGPYKSGSFPPSPCYGEGSDDNGWYGWKAVFGVNTTNDNSKSDPATVTAENPGPGCPANEVAVDGVAPYPPGDLRVNSAPGQGEWPGIESGNITTSPVTVSWNTAEDDAPSSGIARYYYDLSGSSGSSGTTSATFSLAEGVYDFSVYAEDGAGNANPDDPSSIRFLVCTTPPTPSPPSVNAPDNSLMAGINWNTDDTSYYWQSEVRVQDSDGAQVYDNSLDADSTSVTVPKWETTYSVSVRNENVAGVWSGWSEPTSFKTHDTGSTLTKPGSPQLQKTDDSPPGESLASPVTNDTTPTFTWDASTDSASGLMGYYVALDHVPSSSDEFVSTASWTLSSPLEDGSYSLYVCSADNAGNLSDNPGLAGAAGPLDFTIQTRSPDAVQPSVQPCDGNGQVNTLTPTIVWSTSANYGGSSDCTWKSDIRVNQAAQPFLSQDGWQGDSWAVPAGMLSWGGIYSVSVETWDIAGNCSGWGTATDFSLPAPQSPTDPGTPSVLNITKNSATISWDASSDPAGLPITYDVNYKQDGTSAWSQLTTSGTTLTLGAPPLVSLTSGKVYNVQVCATDGRAGVGTSGWAVGDDFKTAYDLMTDFVQGPKRGTPLDELDTDPTSQDDSVLARNQTVQVGIDDRFQFTVAATQGDDFSLRLQPVVGGTLTGVYVNLLTLGGSPVATGQTVDDGQAIVLSGFLPNGGGGTTDYMVNVSDAGNAPVAYNSGISSLPDDPARAAWGTLIDISSSPLLTQTVHPVSLNWSQRRPPPTRPRATRRPGSSSMAATSSPTAPYMAELTQAVTVYAKSQPSAQQVLTLDWHQAAAPATGLTSAFDLTEERWIPHAGQWAADALSGMGISGGNLNLIGHSWGAVVAGELAQDTSGGVNTIVALDPALDPKTPASALDIMNSAISSQWLGLLASALNAVAAPDYNTDTAVNFGAFELVLGILGQLVGFADLDAHRGRIVRSQLSGPEFLHQRDDGTRCHRAVLHHDAPKGQQRAPRSDQRAVQLVGADEPGGDDDAPWRSVWSVGPDERSYASLGGGVLGRGHWPVECSAVGAGGA